MTRRCRAAACVLGLVWACGGTGETDTDSASSGTSGTSGTTGIVDGVDMCGVAGSHSVLAADGQCYCEDGYTWTHPYTPTDFGCSEVAPRPIDCAQTCDPSALATSDCACDCKVGDTWCSADNLADTRCCTDGAQHQLPTHTSADSGSGSDGGSGSTGTSEGSSGGTTATGTSGQ